MEGKIFKLPAECKNLNFYYAKLKQNACVELQQFGISKEPSKLGHGTLQDICNKHPKGALATYVSELQKGFRMNQEELRAYDMEKNNQQRLDDTLVLDLQQRKADWDSLGNDEAFDDSFDLGFNSVDDFFGEE